MLGLLVIVTNCVVGAQDLVGCGGFIRSIVPIPYARIQVCLH